MSSRTKKQTRDRLLLELVGEERRDFRSSEDTSDVLCWKQTMPVLQDCFELPQKVSSVWIRVYSKPKRNGLELKIRWGSNWPVANYLNPETGDVCELCHPALDHLFYDLLGNRKTRKVYIQVEYEE